MKRRQFIIGSSMTGLLYLTGCNGNDEDDDQRDPERIDDDDTVATSLIGKAEKGPFLKDTEITATAYDLNWDQSDFPKEGYTEQDDGSYEIYSPVSGDFVRMRIEGESYNEVEQRYDWVSLRDISRNDSTTKNLNPLTHLLDIVSFDHCRDITHEFYRQGDNCITRAKSEIMSYLGFNDYGVDFNKMSLQGNTISDAQMAVFSWYIASSRTGPEQNDHLREVANGVFDNDLVLKQSIQDFMWLMPFKKISDNLMDKYSSMDVSADRIPFWMLPQVPDYYSDLMNRTPVVLDSKNTTYTTTGVIDVVDYDKFAYPLQFTSPDPKYIALNLENAKSIWTAKTHGDGYLCPDVKVADLVQMNEALLENPVKLQYNYSVSGSLDSGVQYFIVQEFDELTAPSKLTQGEMAPFGSSLASVDGVDWIGHDNVTNWFTRSIKYYTVD